MPIVSRQVSLNIPQGTFTGNNATTNHVRLTNNRMVIIHSITGVAPDNFTRALTIVDMADGLDTDVTSPEIIKTVGYVDKESLGTFGVSIARLSDTRFVVSEAKSTGAVKIEIFEVSGTTITRALTTNVLSNTGVTNTNARSTHVLIPLSATRFIQTYNFNNSGNFLTGYVVYNFAPAVVGPPAVAAALTQVREFRETATSSNMNIDITRHRIPGTTNTMIVWKVVTALFIAFQTGVWIVDEQGEQVRARFSVDGEPVPLGPNRYVVSKWGTQTYYKMDGTIDGRTADVAYTGDVGDNSRYRPILIPLNNDHHIQMRREFFQEQDTTMFMKVVRRDDSNFHTPSTWSKTTWYGAPIYSSQTTQRMTLPFDKRTPILTSNNRLFWAGLWSGTYRWNMLKATTDLPVNPPATAPIAGPQRNLAALFTFDNGLPPGATLSGTQLRYLTSPDSGAGTTGVIATWTHTNSIYWISNITFTIPTGMNRVRIRYMGDSEPCCDTYRIFIDGTALISQKGSSGGWREVLGSVSGGTTSTMRLEYQTDGSVDGGISGVYVSLVEFTTV